MKMKTMAIVVKNYSIVAIVEGMTADVLTVGRAMLAKCAGSKRQIKY